MVTSSAMFGIFQSIGKAHIPLVLMIGSVLIKLVLNPLLISIPQLNIAGAALSSIIGYVFMTIGGAIKMRKYLPKKISLFKAVFPTFICGVGCGFAAFLANNILTDKVNPVLNVLFSTVIGGVSYVILLIFTGVFRTNSIIKRKNVKKFQKPLAK